jgi:hypothetical protein
MASLSKCLAKINKSRAVSKATKKRNHSASASMRWGFNL